MRALAVLLMLPVPLVAGDDPSLREAVALFRSEDATRRAAGSQMADRALRRLLAPLLEALKDKDPEVRRRARRSILSLVPGEAEKQPPVVVSVIGIAGGVGHAFGGRAGHRGFRRVRAASPPVQQQRAALTRKGSRLLKGLGLRWKTRWKAPLMPGFLVTAVEKGSAAARLGVRPGDLIVRVDGRDVTRIRDVGKAPDWSRATLTVYRGGRYVRLSAK